MHDLTTRDGVVAHISESTSRNDWDRRCDEVKDANGSSYPSFWYAAVVASGLFEQVVGEKPILQVDILTAPQPTGQTAATTSEGDVLKTPAEWQDYLAAEDTPDNIWRLMKIGDPDGWRGANGRPFTDRITREEFEQRAGYCTLFQRD